MRDQHKSKKLKIIASTWNHEFELPEFFREFMKIMVYSEILFSKNSLTDFYITPVFTERSFRTDIKNYIV